jgi:diguanylate cyclase (GGDEF)-like protein
MGAPLTELVKPPINPDLNPYVGNMASRLVRSFSGEGAGQDPERWQLVLEVLGFAVEAEQKLTEQRQRIDQLESLTMTDELTGVGNRRGMDDFLKRALANARRHGETGVIGFLDLDDFKAINDRLGHEAGDRALKKVAHLLTANTRVADYVARIGGDEFVVILTHCTERDGRKRMKDLRAFLDQSLLGSGTENIETTLRASLGVAAYDGESDAACLLQTADALMYSDKLDRRHSRNTAFKKQALTG